MIASLSVAKPETTASDEQRERGSRPLLLAYHAEAALSRIVGAASAATILPKPLPLGPIARSARGSATELEELALGVRRRQGGRPLVRGRRLALTAQSLK